MGYRSGFTGIKKCNGLELIGNKGIYSTGDILQFRFMRSWVFGSDGF